MAPARVITLDLNFQGRKHAIASYLIRHADAAILIESGPGYSGLVVKKGSKAWASVPSSMPAPLSVTASRT